MNDINPGSSAGDASAEDRTLAMLTHLSGIILGFIVPLIVWLMNKDKPGKGFLVEQAKEALNFTITLLIVYVALTFLAIITLGILGLITGPLSLLVWIVSIVFFVIAGMKANNGEQYRYPMTLRLIK
ncbi:MAG TPA: DUF4870 domain-containing protein [Lysobacter sp.]|nr:DUF4870 domain-containing protein [Lysobacter sp.]